MSDEPFFTKKVGPSELRVYQNDKYRFVIRGFVDGRLVLVSEKTGAFWRKAKAYHNLVEELVGARIILRKDDLNGFSTEVEHAYTAALAEDAAHKAAEAGERGEGKTVKTSYERLKSYISNGDLIYVNNPSIGQIRDLMFTMFTLPKRGQNGVQFDAYLVWSDRRIDLVDEEMLEREQILFQFLPQFVDTRWSYPSIESFLDTSVPLDGLYSFNILDRIAHQYGAHIDFYEGPIVTKLLALWTIGTYFQHVFHTYPYIFLNGVKASGKSKTLDVTRQLAFNAFASALMSTASLFRLIQSTSATMLVDEAESLRNKDRREGFREIMLAGYKKGTSTFRVEEQKVGDIKTFVVKEFFLFSPKMIANIAGLEDVLESRAIPVTMKPTVNQKIANLDIDPTSAHWQNLRDEIYVFAMASWQMIMSIYQLEQNDGYFKNREWELWKPILALARHFTTAENNLHAEILEFAKKKVAEARQEDITETDDAQLVELLLDLVTVDGWYSIKSVMSPLAVKLDIPTQKLSDETVRYPKWFNARRVGAMFRRLGFKNKKRTKHGYMVRLTKQDVLDQALRMGITIEDIKSAEQEIEADQKQRTESKLTSFGGADQASTSTMSSIEDAIVDVLHGMKGDGGDLVFIAAKVLNYPGLNPSEDKIVEAIDRLKANGTIFEPRPSKFKLL